MPPSAQFRCQRYTAGRLTSERRVFSAADSRSAEDKLLRLHN
jgi:hypothetical protein